MRLSDTEVKVKGMNLLSQGLGLVDAERFVSLIQRDRSDYTKWRQDLFQGKSGDELSKEAQEYQKEISEGL